MKQSADAKRVTDGVLSGRVYPWLLASGASVLLLSMFLGYGALIVAPVGAVLVVASLIVGTRWLDRQPSLRQVAKPHVVMLGLAVLGTWGAACLVLRAPNYYWIYWLGLLLVVLNTVCWVRQRQRAATLASVFVLLFGVVAPVSVRSAGISRAVEADKINHVRLFLWLGADPNLRRLHDPLLITAVKTQDLETVRLLLDHGADPNIQTSPVRANTPALSEAAGLENLAILELLLKRGATPNRANSWGETPLGRAARNGQLAVCKVLLAAGADPNQADGYGRRPLEVARHYQHLDVQALLEQ